MQKPTISLREEQIAFFHREGYLAIPAITTPEEIERLIGIYDHLFAIKAGRAEGNQYDLAGTDEDDKEAAVSQIVHLSRYAPELVNLLYWVNAQAIAAQLLGLEVEMQSDHGIMKPPGSDAPTPWHQDEAYWRPDLVHNAVTIWMPLQEVTLENGCMQFIPSSHTGEVSSHHSIGHDPRVHGLEVDSVEASKAVACPIPAGGATIHHCRTLHYTGPNRTDKPRRAYILNFAAPTTKLEISRDFYWQGMRQTARDERRKKAGTVSTSGGKLRDKG